MSFLSDSEWLCLNDLVLSINSIDNDREFRSTVLKKLRFLIPYESAAFFLSDLSKNLVSTPQEWKTRVFLDPLGIDVPAGMLERYTEEYWQQDMIVAHRNLTRSTVLRESDQLSPGDIESSYMKDYLDGRHVVNASFFNDEGFLGSLNLNRKKEEGDFTDREVQILELIEPHLTNRLSKWRVRADRSSSEVVFAHDYDVSAREIDVCRCVLSGMDNAAIAEELCISTGTVKKHLENIFRKTQVNSRVGLMALLQQYTALKQ